jgi:hypothetical protein
MSIWVEGKDSHFLKSCFKPAGTIFWGLFSVNSMTYIFTFLQDFIILGDRNRQQVIVYRTAVIPLRHWHTPLVPILIQMNPVHTLTSYLFKIHFNIILANWLFISFPASKYSERTQRLRYFSAWKQTLGGCRGHHRAPARPVASHQPGHDDSWQHREAEAKHAAVHPKQLPVLLYCTIPGWENKCSVTVLEGTYLQQQSTCKFKERVP